MANRNSAQTQYTVGFAALSADATSNDIALFTLRAGHVLERLDIQAATAFRGGAIATFTLSVGIAGDLAKFASAFDVYQNTGGDVGQHSVCEALESTTKDTTVRIAAVTTGGNLSVATQGSVNVVATTRKTF